MYEGNWQDLKMKKREKKRVKMVRNRVKKYRPAFEVQYV